MTSFKLSLIALAALGLAACSDNSSFDNAGAGGANGGFASGSASDPTSVAYFQQTVGDRVFFAVDQSTLSAQATSVLDQQATWLMTNAAYTVVIEGHADEQGTREYNLALGARRANSVQEYLVSRGVSPARVRTVSYGKERPLALCSAESCYAENRRAVTVVTAGGNS
ncbi:MAG: peptidoglycan-associated lipoprotein Pal [Rhodovulum sp.]|jgi:peptidoglycan-associated lipoprotein|nr:peptidoglycan-associated lipoprotein Pal [Rhodovulum sp.]MEC8630136.1 peptidoglycan-associated lipoprotein Pal [Pseudomonadota bacterium]MEC8796905.1 peptidoglycan-associated lipoprotein Pal [Pseudomonadota bacterium]